MQDYFIYVTKWPHLREQEDVLTDSDASQSDDAAADRDSNEQLFDRGHDRYGTADREMLSPLSSQLLFKYVLLLNTRENTLHASSLSTDSRSKLELPYGKVI